jgi:predicted nucleic acid-binding protein
VKFWDSSALVPVLVREAATKGVASALAVDPSVLVWWGTPIECVSAIARREREGALSVAGAAVAFRRLEAIRTAWAEVQPSERLRSTAHRLLRTHVLRGGDALQLAAAIAAAEDQPGSLPFVTLDDRLAEAAAREGFGVVRPI